MSFGVWYSNTRWLASTQLIGCLKCTPFTYRQQLVLKLISDVFEYSFNYWYMGWYQVILPTTRTLFFYLFIYTGTLVILTGLGNKFVSICKFGIIIRFSRMSAQYSFFNYFILEIYDNLLIPLFFRVCLRLMEPVKFFLYDS